MAKERIELVSSKDSPTGIAGQNIDGTFVQRPKGAPTIQADQIGSEGALTLPKPISLSRAQNALGATVEPSEARPEVVKAVDEPQRPQDALVGRILSNIEQSRTRGDRTEQVLAEEGVKAKREQVDSIQDEIRRRDAFFRRQEEDLAEQGGGLQGGMQAELNTLRRTRNRELADLRIQEQVSLDSFNTANSIAQQKIAAEFEPLQQEIQNLTAVYNLMQNDLTESEKMQVQAKIASKQNNTQLAQSTAAQVHQLLFESGAATPERLKVVNDGMQAAFDAISQGENPSEAIGKMRSAISGVESLAQQQFAFQREQFYTSLAQNAAKLSETIQAENLEETEAVQLEAESAIGIQTLINDLINHPRRKLSTGFSSILPSIRPLSNDFDLTHQQLKDTLTRDNLDALKGLGAMSERELALIEKSSTKLSTKLPEKVYVEELQKIQSSLAGTFKKAQEMGVFEPSELGPIMGFDTSDMEDFSSLGVASTPATFNPATFYGSN